MDHPYRKKVINIVITIVVLVSLSVGGYFYYKYDSAYKNNLNKGPNREVQDLINKVSKLYLLPTGEEPTVATVSDPAVLKNQSFFTLSEKGDKVLIYTKAGRAVLYRPSIDKIIEVAPINNNQVTPNNIQDVATPKEKTKTN